MNISLHDESSGGVNPIGRDNLTERVYLEIRTGLMEGRFWPGHRFKIRQLAEAMGVSETPIREAFMQLAREKGIEMKAARSLIVAELTLAQYLELRRIRLLLEGLAAEAATKNITDAAIKEMTSAHKSLIAAEKSKNWREAVRANWLFHSTVFKYAKMPELLAILENIWLRNGPLINYQYPHAPPSYKGRHQHLNVLDALKARQPKKVSAAIQADMMEGGQPLIELLERLESGKITREELRASAGAKDTY
jgi:DNA-binding GntR family transcriptional regulator